MWCHQNQSLAGFGGKVAEHFVNVNTSGEVVAAVFPETLEDHGGNGPSLSLSHLDLLLFISNYLCTRHFFHLSYRLPCTSPNWFLFERELLNAKLEENLCLGRYNLCYA